MTTFIIDCPYCRAKVGAEQHSQLEGKWTEYDYDVSENEVQTEFCEQLFLGTCPRCQRLVVGRSERLDYNTELGWETWGDVIRVYPKPPKAFISPRIPGSLNISLLEAERCLQAGAFIAACAMLGRALEALCHDALRDWPEEIGKKPGKYLTLGNGIRQLRERKIIDDRLFDWSQSLHAMRNLAAHSTDINADREDVEDLQAFAYAVTEYVYDLTDRYNEFKAREAERKKPRKSIADMFGDIAKRGPEPE